MGQTLPVAPDVYTTGEPLPPDGPASADALFDEARGAAADGAAEEAFRLATQAVLADPQHADARRVLGYESVDGQWLTPYQARQQKRGFRWDGRYGWLSQEDLPRYEAGERRIGRRWIDQAADAEAHREIERGWVVRTDNFAVQSNESLESAARLAAELESFHQAWRTAFAGYLYGDRECEAFFHDARRPPVRKRPLRVFYHRDKPTYVDHLRRRQPRVGETLGIYFDDAREAHFYHSDAADDAALLRATLYHEAAHQLFAESGPGRPGAGRDANFWLVEGVACYYEMLRPIDGRAGFTLGHPAQGRLPSAVAYGPAMPLAQLAGLGMTDLQRVEQLPRAYAQAAGVVTMLRHGPHAARDALVATLREVYSRSDAPDELTRQTGRSWEELDRQYREFLANLSE